MTYIHPPDEDTGISPVVGAILMVAITVILAAVILFFVTDLANQPQAAQAGVTIDETPAGVELTLNNVQNADSISVSADGTVVHTWDDTAIGDKITIVGVSTADSLTITGTVDNSETVLQTYEVNTDHSPALSPQLAGAGGGSGTVASTVPLTYNYYGGSSSGTLDRTTPWTLLVGGPSGLLPGDDYTSNMTLENTGSGDITMEFSLAQIESVESGTCGGMESSVDSDCSTAGAPGEMDESMAAAVYWYDPSTGTQDYVIGSSGSKVGVDTMTLGTKSTTVTIPSGETRYLIIDWEFLASTGNEAKTDTFVFEGTVTEV